MSQGEEVAARRWRVVGSWRRFTAAGIDLVCVLPLIVLGYKFGWFDARPWQVPKDWFWSEWWLSLWLDHPPLFTAPVLWSLIVAMVGHLVCMVGLGRTPGMWVMRLVVVDERGERASWKRLGARALCNVMHPMSLGLTYLWMIPSRWGQGVHDWVSGCWVVGVGDFKKGASKP